MCLRLDDRRLFLTNYRSEFRIVDIKLCTFAVIILTRENRRNKSRSITISVECWTKWNISFLITVLLWKKFVIASIIPSNILTNCTFAQRKSGHSLIIGQIWLTPGPLSAFKELKNEPPCTFMWTLFLVAQVWIFEIWLYLI